MPAEENWRERKLYTPSVEGGMEVGHVVKAGGGGLRRRNACPFTLLTSYLKYTSVKDIVSLNFHFMSVGSALFSTITLAHSSQ
jgi:hypothetical protein